MKFINRYLIATALASLPALAATPKILCGIQVSIPGQDELIKSEVVEVATGEGTTITKNGYVLYANIDVVDGITIVCDSGFGLTLKLSVGQMNQSTLHTISSTCVADKEKFTQTLTLNKKDKSGASAVCNSAANP